MMPRFRVTMRDGRKIDVDAADASHARKLAAQKIGTAYPGVSAERMGGANDGERSSGQLNARRPAPTRLPMESSPSLRLYEVTFQDGTKIRVRATSERSARIRAHDERASTQWGVPTALPIKSVKDKGV